MIGCAPLALYSSRSGRCDTGVDTFDERHSRLTGDGVNGDCNGYNPDHGRMYRLIGTIWKAAHLAAKRGKSAIS